ncbi:hypothetical protein [Paenibacillus ginsengihumi]|uniref:hypothetical protein n=1 Tax=Paenibacillus ginsengihumi TaxID=431596 RepID=UPI00037D51FB|nr:hypothetical protein [Paenibacillus ginsengihumi]
MIPHDGPSPYKAIFNFTPFDFGEHTPLDKAVWNRVVKRLPKSYSLPDQELLAAFLKQIGVAVKSREEIDREYEAILIRRKGGRR